MNKLIGLILAATVASVGLVKAETPDIKPQKEECKFCKTKREFYDRKLEFLKKELNLSQEQVQKISLIKQEEKEALEKFRKEHKMPLEEATKGGEFNRDIFINTVKQNSEKMAQIKAEYFQKLFEVLDKNQREKFLSLIHKRTKNEM
ncbi:MAG: hypothetical protein ABWJ98_07890 [Hydrogenothermaceae bacterium]